MLLQALARMTDEEPFVLRAEVRRGETGLLPRFPQDATSGGPRATCNTARTGQRDGVQPARLAARLSALCRPPHATPLVASGA
jgi:hypothetical protein